jgi:hypothetical protein
VKAKKYLSFRDLDFWNLERLRRFPEVKSEVRRVTVCVGKGVLVGEDAVEGAREHLGR